MGYLERIFLGTMLLTALLILFLFGLYFDVGGMVAGTFQGRQLGFGQDLEAVRSRRRIAYSDEDKRQDNTPRTSFATGPRARPSSPVNYDRFVRRRPSVQKEVLVDREVRRLKRKGHTDEEYIRMTALYEVDHSLVPIFDDYDRLVDAEDYEAAIDILREARKHVDPENPLALRDILQYLGQAYILAGQDEEARKNLEELMSLQERILEIEKRAQLHQDKEGQEYLVKMQESFSHVREAMDKVDGTPEHLKHLTPFARAREIANPNKKIKIPPQGIAQLKAQMMQRVGKGPPDGISEEQFQKLLEKLEAEELPGG